MNAITTTPTVSADIFGTTLTLNFSNGQELALNAALLNDELRTYAMMHGLKQKLVDAAAIKRNPITGGSATVNDKFDAVKEIFDRLTNGGPWNKLREGGAAPKNGGLLATAIMQMKGISREQVLAFLEGKTAEQKTALRKNPRIAAIIAELQSAAADESIDTDSMLDELGDVAEPHDEPAAPVVDKREPKKSGKRADKLDKALV